MRIVWTSVAFVAGVAAAIVFRLAPGHAVPDLVFALVSAGVVLASLALILMRRRAAIALLCVVFLIGCWRGGDAIVEIEQGEPSTSPALVSSLGQLRLSIASTLAEHTGSTHSRLPTALLIGDRSGLSSRVTNDFRAAGLAHLLAISGLHVSLVGGLVMVAVTFMFGRRRYLHLVLPMVAVLAYAAIAGFAPPITRAAIMFSVVVLGIFMGRGSHAAAALALAAMLMVAIEPVILASLSFQLSFAAMLGISSVTPALGGFFEIWTSNTTQDNRGNFVRRIRRFIFGSLAVSLASTLGTLPLVALHFDAVPVWGPLATLLAVPAMPLLITFSALVAALGAFPVPLLPEIAAIPVITTTQYAKFIAGFFAHLPPRPVETGGWSVWMTFTYYAIAAMLIALWPRVIGFSTRLQLRLQNPNGGFVSVTNRNVGVLLAVTVLLLLTGTGFWSIVVARNEPNAYLSVQFLETAHGESIFIETPNGNRMLVDGGGNRTQVADRLRSMLPLWNRDVDIVLLTHPDADHVGGLAEVLNQFQVGAVVHVGASASDGVLSEWSAAIKRHKNVIEAWPGMVIGLDHGIFVEVLAAGCIGKTTECANDNNASIVTKLSIGDVSFLLTGDIERAAEIRLATSNPNLLATVLKAPHHGSNTSSTSYFINAVQPAAVVVAAGTQNQYGHPHADVMARLNNAVGEERVFRTDLMGTVELRTDGERLWMVR